MAFEADKIVQAALEHLRAGRLQDADLSLRRALQMQPDHADALHALGLIATRKGRPQDAIRLIRRAISLRPDDAAFYYNLAEPCRLIGQVEPAEQALRRAIELRPEFAQAHGNLGVVLLSRKRMADAEKHFRAAIALEPNHAADHANLGKALDGQERLDEAVAEMRRAIQLAPREHGFHSLLGTFLRAGGRIDEAIECFRRAIALNDKDRRAASNLVYAVQFSPDLTPQQVLDEHLEWAKRFATPLRSQHRPHANNRDPHRRLRIGYVSPDLNDNVIGLFMEPILSHHGRRQVEVFCYADVPVPDDVSRRLSGKADLWRMTAGLNDAQLAEQIRDDGIDVLIDLVMHMRGSRLLAFSLKPAPVQITHLAYCASSGLAEMDYCITDPFLDPPAGPVTPRTEKPLRLSRCYWCYNPWPDSPDVGPPPFERNGFVTFGSLNALAKVNPHVLNLWARILQEIPSARLALHIPGGAANTSALRYITGHGIDPARLIAFGYRRPPREYLKLYNEIDIALDPFPYAGGTTTLDALWMGVPPMTLRGQTALSRTGVTLLSNLAMPELIASDADAYISLARSLAADHSRLATLRVTLRDRLKASPIMDVSMYVADLEGVYRKAWKTWCETAQ